MVVSKVDAKKLKEALEQFGSLQNAVENLQREKRLLEGNQVTTRQPEEVKSRTSHARRSGGCTANNTRLGSPEDA
ncbi:unnamed protein product [marine sediment metagenome]|uniref:Uncharacterized protein n=1 Tax=marine sediment metagenome TaxID=412755 RepID=X1VRY8_9ZZZZ